MKTISFFLVVTIFISNSYSQNLFEKKGFGIDDLTMHPINLSKQKNVGSRNSLSIADLSYDCSSVFWTVNANGDIQQWNLNSNQVTGGEIIVSNSGNSIAFCGGVGAATFYSTTQYTTGIQKYDTNLGWVTIPTSMELYNNGGYKEDQYFYGSSSDLYHFDGINLNLIESLRSITFFTVADIAVDSLGRAWVFTSTSLGSINGLRVYDHNGLVASYPFSYSSWGAYGSFFINDQLYLGIGGTNNTPFPNSILPINFDGANVTVGTPIPFLYDNYYDMASCNKLSSMNTQSNYFNNELMIYPNPSKDIVTINLDENIISVEIYSTEGKLVKLFNDSKTISISDLENNMYILKIVSENNVYNRFIIKK